MPRTGRKFELRGLKSVQSGFSQILEQGELKGTLL